MYQDTQKSMTKQCPSLKHTRLILPILPENWRKIRNAALSANMYFSYVLGNTTWQWQIKPHGESFIQPNQWACLLHIRVGGHLCQCYLETLAPLALDPIPYEDLALMPQELLNILFQTSIQTILENLSQTVGFQCELADFMLATQQDTQQALTFQPLEEGLAFSLTAQDSQNTTRGYLLAELPHPLFDSIFTYAQSKNLQKDSLPPSIKEKICLNVPVIKTLSNITIQDINTLGVGDCLLFPAQENTPSVHLHIDTICKIQATWDRQRQHLILEKSMQDENLTDEMTGEISLEESFAEENTSAPPLLDTQQCTVPVHCHLGSVSVSLASLGNLCPGMVLGPLDGVDAPVTVRVGNTTVGRGALIDIEGRIGVQLTEVFLQNKS